MGLKNKVMFPGILSYKKLTILCCFCIVAMCSFLFQKTVNKKVFTGIDKIKPVEEETTVRRQNSSINIISALETIKPPGAIEEPSLDPNKLSKQTEKSTEQNL